MKHCILQDMPEAINVRKALIAVLERAEPQLTESQFDDLYGQILEAEMFSVTPRASNILNKFFKENGISIVR